MIGDAAALCMSTDGVVAVLLMRRARRENQERSTAGIFGERPLLTATPPSCVSTDGCHRLTRMVSSPSKARLRSSMLPGRPGCVRRQPPECAPSLAAPEDWVVACTWVGIGSQPQGGSSGGLLSGGSLQARLSRRRRPLHCRRPGQCWRRGGQISSGDCTREGCCTNIGRW